jgi:hypothetical protein
MADNETPATSMKETLDELEYAIREGIYGDDRMTRKQCDEALSAVTEFRRITDEAFKMGGECMTSLQMERDINLEATRILKERNARLVADLQRIGDLISEIPSGGHSNQELAIRDIVKEATTRG